MSRQPARPLDRLIPDPHLWGALLAPLGVWGWLWSQGGGEHFQPGWILIHPGIFLGQALLYPVLEELVFRGMMQGGLKRIKRLQTPLLATLLTPANLLTSIAFSMAHLYLRDPWTGLMVFFPSLLFGHFRDRYNHLAPSIGLHILFNAGYFWLFFNPATFG
ncbi:MAG: JDVT-CTERM system CAAX-type protease [Magnetococcales bacterium]|nr:JDVT-CTERM system CAAX-type protease [Magnetococcales bacterium]